MEGDSVRAVHKHTSNKGPRVSLANLARLSLVCSESVLVCHNQIPEEPRLMKKMKILRHP